MSELREGLIKRFGEQRVNTIPPKEDTDIELLQLDLELRSPTKVIMTHGLSNYEMPVPKKYEDKAFNEIYFCLPSYWEIESNEERFKWPFTWIQKLALHVVNKNTWYGPGHTFSNGNPPLSFSETMKCKHLILCEPIFLEEHLQPIELKEKVIHFLGGIPLFDNELEYKNNKGYRKFIRKYRAKNNNELLDDFRESCLKLKFGLF